MEIFDTDTSSPFPLQVGTKGIGIVILTHIGKGEEKLSVAKTSPWIFRSEICLQSIFSDYKTKFLSLGHQVPRENSKASKILLGHPVHYLKPASQLHSSASGVCMIKQ